MLFIRVELRPSSIHGVGVFLMEPVKKGQLVWRFDELIDRTYAETDLKRMSGVCREMLDDYGCWDEKRRLWLLYGDEMRYINHSADPVLLASGGPSGQAVAARDLAADQELSVNYHLICDMTRSNGIFYEAGADKEFMIGKLTGTIDSVAGSQLVLDANGVGYVVTCSARTLRHLGPAASAASLLIETQVREDAISLYGFADRAEQDWFRLLTTVQGVGARVALSILSTLAPDDLAQVIAAQDKAALTQADGVGPKLALRLVTELKDKFPASIAEVTPLRGVKGGASASDTLASDAVSALLNLGYRRAEAFGAVATASRKLESGARLDDLIRASLAELSREKVA